MKIIIAIIVVSIIIAISGPPFMNLYQSSEVGECGYIAKHQLVRLLDIFVLGPAGIYLGHKILTEQAINPVWGVGAIIYGISTIYYNGANYLHNAEK